MTSMIKGSQKLNEIAFCTATNLERVVYMGFLGIVSIV